MESLNDRLVAEREAHSLTARLEKAQCTLAQRLRRAAERIYQPGRETDSTHEMSAISALGVQASALLTKSADYLERVHPKTIQVDLTRQVQHNPGASLLIAGTAGFILSSMLRRR